jgi:hypothetical protein
MKQLALCILLVSGIIFYLSCSNEKGNSNFEAKTDTCWTAIMYAFDWNNNDHRPATARRIIQDVYKLVPVDSSGGEVTSKKRWVKDTTYLVPLFDPVMDSLKRPLKTITGKDSTKLIWAKLPMEFLLVDYNKRFK